MYWRKFLFLSFVFLFFANPSWGTGLGDLPDDVIRLVARNFTHKDIVRTFGRLNHKFNELSKQDWTWRNTHIIQSQGKDECGECDLFITKLKKNNNLPIEKLYISVEKIYPEELQVLGRWLFTNNKLKSLSLVRCGLTGNGYPRGEDYLFVNGLKTWLETNEVLEELDLSGNPLKYSTASITEVLKKNKRLKRLILDSTYPKSDMFSETFEEDLAENKTLRYFSFRNNKLPAIEYLTPILKRDSSLPQIEVDITGTTSESGF